MTNSTTEHSKKLRRKTANTNKTKNYSQRVCVFNMRKQEDVDLFNFFNDLDGDTSYKFKKMITFFRENN